jgi:hypothetical protein
MWPFNLFKKEKIIAETPKEWSKYIQVSIVAFFPISYSYEEVKTIAEDMSMILHNTNTVYNNQDPIGCVNPYLKIDSVFHNSTISSKNKLVLKKITRDFTPVISKENEFWKISLIPLNEDGTVDLYSTVNLYWDYPILLQTSDWIIKKYDIKLNLKESYRASSNIFLVDDEPCIEYIQPLMNIKYNIKQRLLDYKSDSKHDSNAFGEDFNTMIRRFKFENKKIKLNEEQKLWWIKVEELLK